MELIKKASSCSFINNNPASLVLEAIHRVVRKYYKEIDADFLVKHTRYVIAKYGYLTIEELELAFDFSLSGSLDIDYQPKELTFGHLEKVIKSYSWKTFKIKKPDAKITLTEGRDWAAEWRILKHWILFYRLIPIKFIYAEIVNHLIETKEIGTPDGWDMNRSAEEVNHHGAQVVKWWIELSHPEYKLKSNYE